MIYRETPLRKNLILIGAAGILTLVVYLLAFRLSAPDARKADTSYRNHEQTWRLLRNGEGKLDHQYQLALTVMRSENKAAFCVIDREKFDMTVRLDLPLFHRLRRLDHIIVYGKFIGVDPDGTVAIRPDSIQNLGYVGELSS